MHQASERAWLAQIAANRTLIARSQGPSVFGVVCGSEADRRYWEAHFRAVAGDVFRVDGDVVVVAVWEQSQKGNCLGTFNAWRELRGGLARRQVGPPPVGLLSMVFGQGKRLSPFTQALGNRKAALPTPYRASDGTTYLCSADLACLYAGSWAAHLASGGFRGLIVKWGDESILPSAAWPSRPDYADLDAVRFIWATEPTETLAREKEWVLFDSALRQMVSQVPRGSLEGLRSRLGAAAQGSVRFGVNLGSFAISYGLLDAACEVLGDQIDDPSWQFDWDPYAWLALTCDDEAAWQRQREHEAEIGLTGLAALQRRYPSFFQRLQQVRRLHESRMGRPLRVGVLDFGDCFWVDLGLQSTLRSSFQALVEDSVAGRVARQLFALDAAPDERGNLLIDSQVPPGARIERSLLVGTTIQDRGSEVVEAVVVGGRFGRLAMPRGGVALFCAADELAIDGARAVALRSVGDSIRVDDGGRHTTLFLPDGPLDLVTDEAVVDYNGPSYSEPIRGNPISFEQAARLVDGLDGQQLEARWRAAWARYPTRTR